METEQIYLILGITWSTVKLWAFLLFFDSYMRSLAYITVSYSSEIRFGEQCHDFACLHSLVLEPPKLPRSISNNSNHNHMKTHLR